MNTKLAFSCIRDNRCPLSRGGWLRFGSIRMTSPPSGLPHVANVLLWMLGISLLSGMQTAFASTINDQQLGNQQMRERFAAFQQHRLTDAAEVPFEVNSSSQGQRYIAEVLGLYQGLSFADLSKLLRQRKHWCGLVFLHPNVKSCAYNSDNGPDQITVYVGKKKYQTPSQAVSFTFNFETALEPESITVLLHAKSGPLGTRDYVSIFQAIEVPEGVFGRWHLDQKLGNAGALINIYYKTLGRRKVGFTPIGVNSSGETKYVGGLRGAIERNFMRYYLAMKVFLETWQLPSEERFEARIEDWFQQSEQYPRQLRDLSRDEYLNSKRKEIVNQLKLQEQN